MLTKVKVVGLLGRFDHEFEFPAHDPFVIIYGPNGVGKTRLLELVAAASRGDFRAVLGMPFSRAELHYDDDYMLVLNRRPNLDEARTTNAGRSPHILEVFLIGKSDGAAFEIEDIDDIWVRQVTRRPGRQITTYTDPDTQWQLFESESYAQLGKQQRLDEHLIESPFRAAWETELRVNKQQQEARERVARFQEETPTLLVETQRLIVQRPSESDDEPDASTPAVARLARSLARQIEQALAENSAISQGLDRSFPNRLLFPSAPEAIQPEDALRERFDRQAQIRYQLAKISVADPTEPIELPDRALDSWERKMLHTYLDDADKKLATLTTLLRKVNLLTQIVNGRFLFKRVEVSREHGLTCISDEGQPIRLTALSSGEQHELVLTYDLLFNVTPNSTVLIDEPEISLHIAWQQRFIEDLVDISALVDARFIVATHSPQVIHTWGSYAHSLFGAVPES